MVFTVSGAGDSCPVSSGPSGGRARGGAQEGPEPAGRGAMSQACARRAEAQLLMPWVQVRVCARSSTSLWVIVRKDCILEQKQNKTSLRAPALAWLPQTGSPRNLSLTPSPAWQVGAWMRAFPGARVTCLARHRPGTPEPWLLICGLGSGSRQSGLRWG